MLLLLLIACRFSFDLQKRREFLDHFKYENFVPKVEPHNSPTFSGLWQMFRTFVLRCDWSILRILKSTKKHERQSERVTLVSIYNNIFRLYHN